MLYIPFGLAYQGHEVLTRGATVSSIGSGQKRVPCCAVVGLGVTVAHVQQGRFKAGAPICVLIDGAHSVWVGLSGPRCGDSRGDGVLDWQWAEKRALLCCRGRHSCTHPAGAFQGG
jgi:hypothetical protein